MIPLKRLWHNLQLVAFKYPNSQALHCFWPTQARVINCHIYLIGRIRSYNVFTSLHSGWNRWWIKIEDHWPLSPYQAWTQCVFVIDYFSECYSGTGTDGFGCDLVLVFAHISFRWWWEHLITDFNWTSHCLLILKPTQLNSSTPSNPLSCQARPMRVTKMLSHHFITET